MKRPSSASCTLRAGASVSRSILSNIGVLRPIYPAGGGARLPPPGSARGQHKGETSVHRLARSEEHTSALQSLMSISSAVSCFNKQTTPPTQLVLYNNIHHTHIITSQHS